MKSFTVVSEELREGNVWQGHPIKMTLRSYCVKVNPNCNSRPHLTPDVGNAIIMDQGKKAAVE